MKKKTASSSKRKQLLSVEQFLERAIKKLRKPGYVGIHCVYSGFNRAFRKYYGKDPRAEIDKLAKKGFLVVVVVRGGVMLNLATEFKGKPREDDALAKILK